MHKMVNKSHICQDWYTLGTQILGGAMLKQQAPNEVGINEAEKIWEPKKGVERQACNDKHIISYITSEIYSAPITMT